MSARCSASDQNPRTDVLTTSQHRWRQRLALTALVVATSLSSLSTFAQAQPHLKGPSPTVTIRHALWDANQRPLYQQCARDFEAMHPQLRIRFEQQGWDDYWMTLSTGFVANTAPDVFTNHIAKYAEFVANGVMLDLQPALSQPDGAAPALHADLYEPGLWTMWQHQGHQYGVPTDWDTIALAVNLDHLQALGQPLEPLRTLHWNPQDGGSFGQMLKRLTVDAQGRRADDPAFDRRQTKVWGYPYPGAGGMMGQTEWSHFAASTGWQFQQQAFDPELRYDDTRFIATMQWLASLPGQGVAPNRDAVGKLGTDAMFMAGRLAMAPIGSWMASHLAKQTPFRYGWIPLPIGPSGQRASMLNSLALSVWSGSARQADAVRWVRYVGSPACQNKLAPAGIVYPAIKGLAQVAADAQSRSGPRTQVFLDAAHDRNQSRLIMPPVVAGAAEINDRMNSALEKVLSGREPAAVLLPKVNAQVTAIARRQGR